MTSDIDPYIEEDIIINFPAPKKYVIEIEIISITRRKMRLVVDGVKCDDTSASSRFAH